MKIPCSNCNQNLDIPEELAGQTIDCPVCNESLIAPEAAVAKLKKIKKEPFERRIQSRAARLHQGSSKVEFGT
jgi:ribosomal protein S27E